MDSIKSGDMVTIVGQNYKEELMALEDIPKEHKIALKDIRMGEFIYKYGETIGIATKDIKRGEHVHIHNVESIKGRIINIAK